MANPIEVVPLVFPENVEFVPNGKPILFGKKGMSLLEFLRGEPVAANALEHQDRRDSPSSK
jgi:hypothetical protein